MDIAEFENRYTTLKKLPLQPKLKPPFYEQFNGELLPFQISGVLSAYIMQRFLIADACGLGKTAQAIGLIALLRSRFEDELPIVVFCEGRNIQQMQNEFYKFMNIRPAILRGTKSYCQCIVNQKPDIVLVNYELFVRRPKMIDGLGDLSLIVLDEASLLKNRQGKTTKAIKRLTKNSRRILALSASPIEINLSDIFSILETFDLSHNILPGYNVLKNRYIQTYLMQGYGRRRFRYEKIVGYKRLEEASQLIAPFYIRRTVQDVETELPEMVFKTDMFTLKPEHLREYQRLKNLSEGEGLSQYHILQQTADFYRSGKTIYSPKMDYVLELLQSDLRDSKVVIYAQHLETLDNIERSIKNAGYRYGVLKGSTSLSERESIKEGFNGGDLQILIANDVIERGVNLPAGQYMFVFDIPHNPKKLIQIAGRIRRISSQHSSVIINLLLVENSHEVEIYENLKLREALSAYMLSDNESEIFGLYADGELDRLSKKF